MNDYPMDPDPPDARDEHGPAPRGGRGGSARGEHTRARGERTRARILAAAVDLLGRDGPDGFSAAALAREAGVSKATVFHHFDAVDLVPLVALEELLLASMTREHYVGLDLRSFLEAMGREVRATARERRAFLKAWFVFFTKGLFDEDVRERLAYGLAEMHVHLSAAVEAHLPSELPLEDGPERLAAWTHLLGAALDGLALNLLLLDDDEMFDRAWSELVDLVLARLDRPGPPAPRTGAPS